MSYRRSPEILALSSGPRDEGRRWRPGHMSLGAALAASALLFAIGFLYVHQSALLLELTAQQEELSLAVKRIEQINHALVVRHDAALSLEHVAETALRELGMVPPEVVYYVPLHDVAK